jgi:hypothetical protein
MRPALSCLLAAILAGSTASSALAAFPGRNGQIAFGGEIADADGSARRPAIAGNRPSWSADGMRVAFVLDGGGIATADADGDDIRVLSADPDDGEPAWAPDGAWIAFSAPVAGDDLLLQQILVMRSDGSERRQLTFADPSNPTSNSQPKWSPDGGTIVFTMQPPACASGLGAVHPDGSPAPVPGPALLSDTLRDADWTPDGSGVALVSTYACLHHNGSDVIGPNGATLASYNPARCSLEQAGCAWFRNESPVVSPDGTQVAYAQTALSVAQIDGIRAVNLDGGGAEADSEPSGTLPEWWGSRKGWPRTGSRASCWPGRWKRAGRSIARAAERAFCASLPFAGARTADAGAAARSSATGKLRSYCASARWPPASAFFTSLRSTRCGACWRSRAHRSTSRRTSRRRTST